jgi:nucleoside-diphosphate-sugar epimerase
MIRGRHEVTCFEAVDPGDGLPFVQGDLRDPDAVERACSGKDAILHIAGMHGAAWEKLGDHASFAVNVDGTKNILEGAVRQGVKRVVFTSSIWATGHLPAAPAYLPVDEAMDREPLELYGLTKILGERMCAYYAERFGLSAICLRPGGILKPEDAPRRWGLIAGAVDARDVARAHILALEAGEALRHGVFIITAEVLSDIEGYRRDPVAAFEKQYPGILGALPEDMKNGLPGMEWYSVEKAKKALGYKPEHNLTL